MNSVINRYSARQAPSPTRCDPAPERCSTCGMLECLCRPRFFAGQVLTADDLNRLKHYVLAKNRLHNRQLHGWGVVNGLEVTCDACGKGVIVSCGYALSPCGDDIVVCDPVTVDVCALIKACKQAERQPCEPPRQPPTPGCDDGESEWVLAIRYTESPAKGIKPMIPSTAPGCGCASSACSCGGGSGGSKTAKSGCGCGGGHANGHGQCNCKSETSRGKPRTAPVQCEPTIICEGFAFDVYKKPPEDTGDDERRSLLNPDSELFKRFECCVDLLIRRMPKMPGPLTPQNVLANPQAWQQWACTFKDFLQRYLSTRPGYNCELLARLNQIVCPPLNTPNLPAVLLQMILLLFFVWIDAVLACFCSALLPPCPEPYPNGCVPLATIKVSGTSCRVLSICNWTIHRKFATTFPALQYWLSILPFGVELRRILDRVCCLIINVPDIGDDRDRGVRPPGAAARPGAEREAEHAEHEEPAGEHGGAFERASQRLNPRPDHPERLHAALSIARAALARGRTPFDPQAFVESAFLAEKDKGDQHLSSVEIDNFPQFLALNQLLRPLALELAGDAGLGSVFRAIGLAGAGREEPARGPAPDVDNLRKEVRDLRADVARQAEEIKRLKRPRKGKG